MGYLKAAIRCGVVLSLALWFAPGAEACNTPVFRYAMYNWAPAPFEVYFFHRGSISKEDEAVHRVLKGLSDAPPATANLTLATVDVAKAQQLGQVPTPIRESWKSKHGSVVPSYLVWSPWGAELFFGPLDQAAVQEMVDSPVRTQVGELLKQGNAVVLLILASSNEAENKRAQSAAKELIALGASGKIPVAGDTSDPPDESTAQTPGNTPADGDKQAASKRLQMAQLLLSRSDPKERWLIRMLLGVEADLPQFAAEPMVFGIYGRGRAMEPFVGKGITTDNLAELAAFLAGACSCQVKDRNPGVDLLFHWDWNATADALAADDPSLSDRQSAYQEMAADAVGGKTLDAAKPAGSAASLPAKSAPGTQKPGAAAVKPAAAQPVDPPATAQPKQAPAAGGPTILPQETDAGEYLGSYSSKQMWKFAAAFAVVTVLVLATGWALMRRQSP